MSRLKSSRSQSYQQLVKEETARVVELGFDNPSSMLSKQAVLRFVDESGLAELVNSGLLIEYGESYRTSHLDLIRRIVFVRNLEPQRPIPFEYKIVAREELVPDFDAHRFEDVLPSMIPDKDIAEVILSVLKEASSFQGLSSHQLPLIRELLSFRSKHVAIVAPTASGKTLTFFLPALVSAIRRALTRRTGTSTILTYPRRALERDQLRAFLRIIDAANQIITKKGGALITIGIDDSETPRKRELRDGMEYHKLKCVACEGELHLRLRSGRVGVACNRCGRGYDYFLPSKDEIWETKPTFLITNLWIVYRRMLSQGTIGLFKELDYVITDEAHIYTHFLGGHISYIMRLLSLASSHNGRPVFVFSSATVPNPKGFVASLAGIQEDDLFYVDYNATLQNASGEKSKRLLLHLYLLPHPQSDIETLTEAVLLATTLWTHKGKTKGILFIDSVSEINTIRDYVHSTILGIREGREVTDHVFQTERNPSNTYSWESLAPEGILSDLSSFKNFVLTGYKRSIDMHYGGLSSEKRVQVESAFAKGEIRFLLSTSTLELGINLSDVAVIIQHKLPLTPEGVVQRIGRAGRDETCFRIALGIVVLPALPLSTLYMYDERLRETLENVAFLPALKIGRSSDSLLLQYTLSLILMRRAMEKKPTHIDIGTEGLKSKADALGIVKMILKELDESMNSKDFTVFLGSKEYAKSSQALKLLLTSLEHGLETLGTGEYAREYESLNAFQANLDRQISTAFDVSELFSDMDEFLPRLSVLTSSWHVALSEARHSLKNLIGRFQDLRKAMRIAMDQSDSRIIESWWSKNNSLLKQLGSTLLTGEKSFLLTSELMGACNKCGGFSRFKNTYGVDPNRLLHLLAEIGQEIGGEDAGLSGFLSSLPKNIEEASTVQMDSLSAFQSLQRFENEARLALGGKLEIFQTLSLLLEGKAHFSLLLDAPSPDLELVGVGEM